MERIFERYQPNRREVEYALREEFDTTPDWDRWVLDYAKKEDLSAVEKEIRRENFIRNPELYSRGDF